MRKLLFAFVLSMMMLGGSFTTYALNCDFDVIVESGGTKMYTSSAMKSSGTSFEEVFYVTPKSSMNGINSNWVSGEKCAFRVVDGSDLNLFRSWAYTKTQGTGSSSLYNKTFSEGYFPNNAIGNHYYRLSISKPINDPYPRLQLVGTWCP